MADTGNEKGERPEKPDSYLEFEYENSKERLSQQTRTIEIFGKEAIKSFRLLLIAIAAATALVGALDLSLLQQLGDQLTAERCALNSPSNCLLSMRGYSLLTAGVLLFTGMGNLAVAGYEARGIRNITNPRDIEGVLTNEMTDEDYLKRRLSIYRDRIRHNDEIISALEAGLAITKASFSLSLFLLGTSVYILTTGGSLGLLLATGVFIILYLPIGLLFLKTPSDYKAADSLYTPDPVYSLDEENVFDEE